jgi:putative SOS response-associated peptidase YedK
MAPLHNRMPVFLFPTEWDSWLNGSFDDLLAFQARKFPDDLIEMEGTPELWAKKGTVWRTCRLQR